MKLKISMLVLTLSFAATGAYAKMAVSDPAPEAPKGVFDKHWLDVCLMDNVPKGQTAEIVEKFCGCINKRMADGEKLTVTQWARMHPREDKICAKEAGWIAK